MIALASEIAGPMSISSVSWQRAGSSGSTSGTYNNFNIYMGVASVSELTDTFEDNYTPGSRTLVYSTSSQTMQAAPDQWMSIPLDTVFEYNGVDNLIVEIEWVGGSNMFFTYMWETGTSRGLMNKNNISSPTGTLYSRMSRLMLSSDNSLGQSTFGAIKSLW